MNTLIFNCPKTGGEIISDIHTDSQSLRSVQQLPVNLFCPICRQVHRLTASHGRLMDVTRVETAASLATR